NPFPNGRTLLHFEGSGQKTAVFIGLDKVADHIGGYDEFIIDITDAAAKALKNPDNKGDVPLAVLCDNSRDLELIPSNFSDFNLYGGIYRYLNLVYVPAVSLERVNITPTVQPNRPARISVKGRLYNPAVQTGNLQISIRILDPKGSVIHSASQKLPPWTGERELLVHEISSPQLWSPKNPNLYHCEVTLTTADGEMKVTERFGLRYTEWVTQGPFKLNGERILIRGT